MKDEIIQYQEEIYTDFGIYELGIDKSSSVWKKSDFDRQGYEDSTIRNMLEVRQKDVREMDIPWFWYTPLLHLFK